MTSVETPAAPSPKRPASGWRTPTVMILGIAFWILIGANLTFVLKKPKQDLQITNPGSQSVEIRNDSASWWDKKTLTLHPGMTGLWTFRDFDQFRITVSDEEPPTPGTTPPPSGITSRSEAWGTPLIQNADGSGTIVLRHASRTAEVRVDDAGNIEFKFTDL